MCLQVRKLDQIGYDLRKATGDGISAEEYERQHNLVTPPSWCLDWLRTSKSFWLCDNNTPSWEDCMIPLTTFH